MDGAKKLDNSKFSIVINNGAEAADAGKNEVTVTVKAPSDTFAYYGSKIIYFTIKGKSLPAVKAGTVPFSGTDTSKAGIASVSAAGLAAGVDYEVTGAADGYTLPGKYV